MTHSIWYRGLPAVAVLAGAVLLLTEAPRGATGRFRSDDPLAREPETQDASKAKPWDIDLIWDLTLNLFTKPGDPSTDVKARNVNTIDEVPDSNWFTNRVGVRPVDLGALALAPLTGSGPAPGRWPVFAPKKAGAAPGFTIRDAAGDVWFVSLDSAGHPEAATAAILVANKNFWGLGYWQVEHHLITVERERLDIAAKASF